MKRDLKLTITGESGTGKSNLLAHIASFLSISGFNIKIEDEDVNELMNTDIISKALKAIREDEHLITLDVIQTSRQIPENNSDGIVYSTHKPEGHYWAVIDEFDEPEVVEVKDSYYKGGNQIVFRSGIEMEIELSNICWIADKPLKFEE